MSTTEAAAAEGQAAATTEPTTNPEEIPFKDPESAEMELKISKDINAMPEEVKDRFKALKVLTDQLHDLDEEEDVAYRAIERKYEILYGHVYAKRAALVKGETQPEEATIAKFEEMKTKLTAEEGYDAVEVPICDVKDIQNTTKGVSGFWLRALLAHTSLQHEVSEKDRSILAYLEDIRLSLHETGFGFDLTFAFESNSYFTGTELKKQFVMTKPNVVEKCVGTTIEWAAGSDPTKEKKKKKSKSGGKTKTVTKTVKCDSFFNFFESVEASEVGKDAMVDEDDDDEENKIGEQMDHDFDMGNDIKDDLVPLALEYYLGVIEKEEEDDDEDDDDDDDDEDDKPKKSKKPAKGGPQKGPNGEECKQQ